MIRAKNNILIQDMSHSVLSNVGIDTKSVTVLNETKNKVFKLIFPRK